MTADREIDRVRRTYQGYDEDYSLRWEASPGNDAIVAEREELLRRLLNKSGLRLSGCRVLELGAGEGRTIESLHRLGVEPSGVTAADLLEEKLRRLRVRVPLAHCCAADGRWLPFRRAAFDVVVVSTLFSSILDQRIAASVAGEVSRVLSPSGFIVWYDMRRPNPFNHATRSLSKRDIHNLFPGFTHHLQSATVVPSLARRLGPATATMYRVLARMPALRTHLIGLLHAQAR